VTTYWLERAWLGPAGGLAHGVLVEVADGRFARVEPGHSTAPGGADRVAGLVVPGLANCHSHAFHRALRGRTQRGRGSFWTWREQMYALAERLDPDSYFTLARAVYREMVAAGFTAVGEFHYLHHGPDGTPYDDPNAMGRALVAAAREAGIRITLLDTCYLAAGIDRPPEGVQRRFSDGTVEAWADRVEALCDLAGPDVAVGAAVHSVRAVPREKIPEVATWAEHHGAPLHAHVSEQVAENQQCLAAHGMTPTGLLADAGALSGRFSAVHATHLTVTDIELLGGAASYACLCPTTERDLGDGIGPSRRLRDAGARLTVGSDSHAVVDGFEELRAVEMHERLTAQQRGHWSAAELLAAGTVDGHRSLGLAGGRIEAGAPADLVVLDPASPRTAGTGAGVETAVFAATSADVTRVVIGGREVFRAEDRPEVGRQLERAVAGVWSG
jgi:formiminoglutamate deiminase